jgi:hypothetical protein
MELSPEEKQRIYLEEKARLESQVQVKRQKQSKAVSQTCLGCAGAFLLLFLLVGMLVSSFSAKKVAASFVPSYQVVEDKDASIGQIKRREVRITLPRGLTRQALKANIEHAARSAFQQQGSGAILVFAYTDGTDTRSAFTAGRCEYAPYGDWSRAGEDVASDEYRATTELVNSYFKPRPKPTGRVAIKLRRRMTETQRRRVFAEICESESKANSEAEQRFPLSSGAGARSNRAGAMRQIGRLARRADALRKRYRVQIATKHGLTKKEMDEITIEGVGESWPMYQ